MKPKLIVHFLVIYLKVEARFAKKYMSFYAYIYTSVYNV